MKKAERKKRMRKGSEQQREVLEQLFVSARFAAVHAVPPYSGCDWIPRTLLMVPTHATHGDLRKGQGEQEVEQLRGIGGGGGGGGGGGEYQEDQGVYLQGMARKLIASDTQKYKEWR